MNHPTAMLKKCRNPAIVLCYSQIKTIFVKSLLKTSVNENRFCHAQP